MESAAINFCSADTVRHNVGTVIEFAGVQPADETPAARKRAFVSALDRLQRTPTPAVAVELMPSVVIVDDARSDAAAVAADLAEDAEPGRPTAAVVPVPSADRSTVALGVAAGLELLAANEPSLYDVVRELIGCIVVAGGSRLEGSSKSSMIGTIYMNPQPHWATARYAETILHETIHVAHFLDQMINPWFAYPHWEYEERGIRARSPIRQVLRPLPLTLEACCVSVTLVEFLWRVGDRTRAVEMCASTVESLTSIEDTRWHLAPRGHAVFDELKAAVMASDAFSVVKA
jgi:hypothetical protein